MIVMNWKGCGWKSYGLFEVLFMHLLGGPEENHKSVSKDNRSLG